MVTLIHPSADIYQGLSIAVEPPPWTRMIGGWLRDNGFEVKIIDQEAERLSEDQVAAKVEGLAVIIAEGHQPSASTQQMVGVRNIAKVLNNKVIIVGNHASALPERTLKEEPVDFVCDGEGPLTIAGLLSGDPLEKIPGLVWKDGKNNPAPLIPIDELHGDVWDLLPMDKYRAHKWQGGKPYASIYTSLGCPFKCSFCMINVFQHKNFYRMRTPSEVVKQIKHLHKSYGVKTFKFADEMFILNPSHYLSICEELEKLNLDLNIWAYARVDTVKPKTLGLLRRAGIQWLALGIEAGSSQVRDGSNKTLKDEDIRDIVKSIQKKGIKVIGNFIFGLPDDTLESMQKTLDLAKSLNLDYANFYSAMAYPGSNLFNQADPKDLPESWSGYSQHSRECRPLPNKNLSSAEILRFRDDAHIDYFNDPPIERELYER